MASFTLSWGSTAGDLLRVSGTSITVSRRLRDAAVGWVRGATAGAERAERAVQFVLEVARLLGPTVRLLAQVRLEEADEDEQQRALLEPDASPLPDSIGRLLTLVASGTA